MDKQLERQENRGNSKKDVSLVVIERLPHYCRELRRMEKEGITVTSSERLGQRLAISPEQIRKDLTWFGAFGRKGVGYTVKDLRQQLEEIIGLYKDWSMVIIGVGHLGSALINFDNFTEMGFIMQAAFDTDPAVIGTKVGNLVVQDAADIETVLASQPVDIGVITTPVGVAQKVADQLVKTGIKGLWVFAPVRLEVPEHIKVVQADLVQSLSVLTYYLNNEDREAVR